MSVARCAVCGEAMQLDELVEVTSCTQPWRRFHVSKPDASRHCFRDGTASVATHRIRDAVKARLARGEAA